MSILQASGKRYLIPVLVLALAASVAAPALALPVPSKTGPGQSLADRSADLASLRAVVDQDEVARAIESQGFTPEQVNQRLAQLSPDELHQLSNRVDQLQAAGVYVPQYIWILIAVLLVVAIASSI